MNTESKTPWTDGLKCDADAAMSTWLIAALSAAVPDIDYIWSPASDLEFGAVTDEHPEEWVQILPGVDTLQHFLRVKLTARLLGFAEVIDFTKGISKIRRYYFMRKSVPQGTLTADVPPNAPIAWYDLRNPSLGLLRTTGAQSDDNAFVLFARMARNDERAFDAWKRSSEYTPGAALVFRFSASGMKREELISAFEHWNGDELYFDVASCCYYAIVHPEQSSSLSAPVRSSGDAVKGLRLD